MSGPTFYSQPHPSMEPTSPPRVPWYHTKFFVVLMLILFFPVGLVLLWTSPVTRTSGRIAWSVIIGLLVLMTVTSPNEPAADGDRSAAAPTEAAAAETRTASAETTPAPKEKPAPEPPPKPVKRKPEWNTVDVSAETNGNLLVAAEILRDQSPSDLMAAADSTVEPATAFKSPWKFYGKPLAFTGAVAIAQAYPPGSDISLALGGGEVAELVLLASDGVTIVDFVLIGDSGDINVGDLATVYGYVIGQVEVENKLGGKTTQLMMVGNAAQ